MILTEKRILENYRTNIAIKAMRRIGILILGGRKARIRTSTIGNAVNNENKKYMPIGGRRIPKTVVTRENSNAQRKIPIITKRNIFTMPKECLRSKPIFLKILFRYVSFCDYRDWETDRKSVV